MFLTPKEILHSYTRIWMTEIVMIFWFVVGLMACLCGLVVYLVIRFPETTWFIAGAFGVWIAVLIALLICLKIKKKRQRDRNLQLNKISHYIELISGGLMLWSKFFSWGKAKKQLNRYK